MDDMLDCLSDRLIAKRADKMARGARLSRPGGVSFHAASSLSGVYTGPANTEVLAATFAGLSDTFVVSSPDMTGSGTIHLGLAYDGTLSGTSSAGLVGVGIAGSVCSGLLSGSCSSLTNYSTNVIYDPSGRIFSRL